MFEILELLHKNFSRHHLFVIASINLEKNLKLIAVAEEKVMYK